MRYAATIALVSIVGSASVSGRFLRSEEEASKQAEVKVSLAVTEGYRITKTPLHAIIENTSDRPQDHFEEWNSWGYGNLAIKWTDSTGKTGTVTRILKGWDRNFPSTVTLQPGEALVREITFDPKDWQGWPEVPGGSRLKLQVTYESSSEPRSSGWAGKVSSKERTFFFQ